MVSHILGEWLAMHTQVKYPYLQNLQWWHYCMKSENVTKAEAPWNLRHSPYQTIALRIIDRALFSFAL